MIPKTVYGSQMHHRAEWTAMQEQGMQPPYNKLPAAPVLYIKPATTFHGFDQSLRLPQGCQQVQARACVGLLFEPNPASVLIESAQSAIKNRAYMVKQAALLCDFTQSQPSLYRPPLRFNAFDGSLALPQFWRPWPASELPAARIETWVNGQYVHHYSAADWICSAEDQIQSVSRFIGWEAGDVLMMGCPPDAPWVKAGDVVETRWNNHVFTRTTLLPGDAA
jgi:5-oxopent-3-ene-1,2,5-tricarboxylate decarboxylase / 2-hydroxyhepta-2,4-diene-1,7-dioate isomerase